MSDGPKVLTLDIETAPILAYTFETRNTNITPVQIIEPTRVICFAAKWLHESSVRFYSEYHHGQPAMIRHAFDLLDEADVVVTYNGDRFDLPHLQREFKQAGLGRPSPSISVDLYKVIKKVEKWPSHKLAYITEQLGLSGKLPNSGFPLWIACLDESDENSDMRHKAWNLMRRYNKQDVRTTEELFTSYRSDVTNMPSLSLWQPEGEELDLLRCPGCGSFKVQQRGWRMTKVRAYRRYQCQECGRWFSETKSDRGVAAS